MLYDVLVVGGGVAGLLAAIEAKTPTNKVALMTKSNVYKSNSAQASGGINAVLDPQDKKAIKSHIDDTYRASLWLGDLKTITYMCENAGSVIKKLQDYGVAFDKNEQGKIAQRPFGGAGENRTCYVADKTGSAIVQALIKKAREVGVEFLMNRYVLNLTTTKKQISGVISLRRYDSMVIINPAKSVILAGGGYAGIYRGNSTNAQDYTGDLTAVCLRAGLMLKDMEFIQFHPTGIAKTNYLVTEAARGEGGYLVNENGERFVDELSTRDKVARAIYEQNLQGKKVYMDLRHVDDEKIRTRLPALYNAAYNQVGVDITKELLEIKPVAHYTMGGVKNEMTKTAIKGLFVCGEMSASNVHGANRLGGNSLLEGCVFGELAGKNAKEYIKQRDFLGIDYNLIIKDIKNIDTLFEGDTTKNFNAIRVSLGNCMFKDVGILRDEMSLQKAFDYVMYLRRQATSLHCINKEKSNNVELISILELRNALEICEAIILAAQKRKESRGAHQRRDFKDMREKYEKHIAIKELKKGYFKVMFEDNSFINKIREFIIN